MKRWLKVLLGVVALLGVSIVGMLLYYVNSYPDVGAAPSLTVEITPERIARGSYLANHVTACMDCHSTRDWEKFSAPLIVETLGKGGDKFDESIGIPGTLYAPNITPHAIGRQTDGELFRTITSGVAADGRTLFPLMPYTAYNSLAEEDVYSLIAYVRSLQPIENDVPASTINFPVNLLIRMAPKPYTRVEMPDTADEYAYGKYLTTIAGCVDCHTPMQEGKPVAGMAFAGGREFDAPLGVIRSVNITPDEETGIGSWSRKDFVDRFTSYADPSFYNRHWKEVGYQTIMPWSMYGGMAERDLGAIYRYLRTVPPIKSKIERFSAK